MLDYCKKHQDNCIVLLQTPRAGDTVDNGKGVVFELAPYTIICHDQEKINKAFKLEEWDKFQLFDVDNCSSLEDMILNLKVEDDYNVVWINEGYQEPKKLHSELKRIGVSIELEACLSYSLSISYEELQRYYKERTKPSYSQTGLFTKVLEDMPEFEGLVGEYFPLDRAHLRHTTFSETGIKFIFTIPKKGSVEIDDLQIPNIQPQLEKEGVSKFIKLIQERLTDE